MESDRSTDCHLNIIHFERFGINYPVHIFDLTLEYSVKCLMVFTNRNEKSQKCRVFECEESARNYGIECFDYPAHGRMLIPR